MMKSRSLSMLCIFLLLFAQVNAQGTNAALNGIVADSSGAVVDDATVTLLNTKTGVSLDTRTNSSGAYSFPSVQPGLYRITAEKTGFKKAIFNDITVEISARLTLNLPMEVGAVTESVEVSASDTATLQREFTSVGGVISGQKVRDLPLPARDVLDLVLTQGGLIGDNFSGARTGSLNITRDGINVQDNRINSGLFSTVFNSVDLVEEVRVITSPADAEFGRGSGQIQIITRSGTNEFHGSVFESHRNTALNANSWNNNRQGLPRNILIRNQFGGRIGGPIKKDKTFFHFLYEGQRVRANDSVTATVFTETARRGLYRFFPGAQNANANALIPTVDLNGNPVRPSTATGDLQSVNVLTRGDPNRNGVDPTGIIQRQLNVMPLPNNFRVGDGLNTAGFTWLRSSSDDFNNYNVRIDHIFNDKHRLSYSYANEKADALNGFLAQPFPSSPGGTFAGDNRFHSLSLTSTFRSNLVNEFRVGTNRPLVRFFAPWELEGGTDLLPTSNGEPFIVNILGATNIINSGNDPQGRISPVYAYADNLSWLKGRHGFKGGVEVRFVSTNGFNSFTVFPRANIGTGAVAVQGINNIPGIGVNSGGASNLLRTLSGSIDTLQQAFNSPGGTDLKFVAGEGKRRTWKQREVAFFFKDDFKVNSNLTLNLGIRYEFYGVPYDPNGKTAAPVGGSQGLFGISGTDASVLFKPGANQGSLTNVELLGPNSSNPDKKLYNNDWNNFGPAVGFSWALPWFGENKTVLRGGYGIGYERNALRLLDVISGDEPGLRIVETFRSPTYLNLANARFPLTPSVQPLATVPLTDRTQTIRAFDENLRTPYYQNWNLTLQRDLGWKTFLELRYVGNKGTKLPRTTNLNEINVFENGILEAFLITQAGGNAALFDRIFMGLNVPGLGIVNGTTRTGSDAVRANSSTQGFLASHSVGGFANYLNTSTQFTGVPGGLLRRVGLPENFVVVNPQFAGSNLVGNFANSSYHSFQIDVTKRFSNGLQFQSNYTFSKALGEEDGDGQELLDSYRTIRNRSLDKKLLGFDIRHAMRNSWTYELPFGPNRKLLNSNNPILSRLVSNWQVGGIFNAFSGSPLTVFAAVNSFNNFGGDNTPLVVGSFPANGGKVQVKGDIIQYLGSLRQVLDPSIARITDKNGVRALSNLRAITDANGNLLLINPTPGLLGNLASNYLIGPGSFRFDLNLIKRIKIKERTNLELRATAINALNHPIWDNPNTDINSTNFGRITGASGTRIMVVDVRVNF